LEAKAVANPECGGAEKQGSVGGKAIFWLLQEQCNDPYKASNKE